MSVDDWDKAKYYGNQVHARFNAFLVLETLFGLLLAASWRGPHQRDMELAIAVIALLATEGLWVTLYRGQKKVHQFEPSDDIPFIRSTAAQHALFVPLLFFAAWLGLIGWLVLDHTDALHRATPWITGVALAAPLVLWFGAGARKRPFEPED